MNPPQNIKALDFYFDQADCLREQRLPIPLRLPIPAESGGTGVATLTDHGVLLGSGTDPITPTAVGATGQVLTGVTGADPTWQDPAAKFVDRGDPASADYSAASFTKDSAWHDLDLSAIVPAGAVAVLLRLLVRNTTNINTSVAFRKNGNTNMVNYFDYRILVANTPHAFDAIVALDANRVLEYYVSNVGTFDVINVTVGGWWK